jgi:GNAT superfamily N-acetyltransferase
LPAGSGPRKLGDVPPRRHLIAPCAGVALERPVPQLRTPTAADRESLARLMLDAYLGTIDYEGETIVEARAEVDGWLASPEAALDQSHVAVEAGTIVSAVLLSRVDGMPFVAYLYTDPAWKGRGLAEGLMRSAMRERAARGDERIHLWVTVGNTPAERIYERLGFVDVPAEGPAPA